MGEESACFGISQGGTLNIRVGKEAFTRGGGYQRYMHTTKNNNGKNLNPQKKRILQKV